MKIGILTQPLHTNYGGLLQAFALQKFLRDMGHDVLTVDYPDRRARIFLRLYFFARRCVGKFLLGRGGSLFSKRPATSAGAAMRRFVEENIRTTNRIFAPARKKDFARYGFDAFVVGSDQVWRPAYSPHMPTFFLDFLGDDARTRRVAYAASFGKDIWEFSQELTALCAPLAKKFHAISVREDSGIALCEKFLGVRAEHVLDPTMLLNAADYAAIVERDETRGFLEKRPAARRLFAYILDDSPEKRATVAGTAAALGLDADEIMPSPEALRCGTAKFPPVSAWLRGFRDSEFVVTDSFHGCVFSIIFNRPFVAIGNAGRGMSRFLSLLKMFDLETRLLTTTDGDALVAGARRLASEAIPWERVNASRAAARERSREFLENALRAGM